MAFVVVQKRINTRIFSMLNGVSNPPPGTVVDHTITRYFSSQKIISRHKTEFCFPSERECLTFFSSLKKWDKAP